MADAPSTPNSAAPAAPAASTAAPSQDSKAAPQQGVQAPVAAQVADLKAVVTDPNASPKAQAAAIKKLKSLQIKVDGQTFEEKLPFEMDDTKENREWMTRQLQMSKAAQKRMGEKAQLENEVRQFMDQLRKNPRKVLSDPTFGVDVKKMAAQLIEEEIANAAKSPDQLEKEKITRELQELKERYENERKTAEGREFQRLQEQEYERYDQLMTQALDKSDLPKSPYVVKKIADYMKLGLTEGYDVTPADVLPLVREEILEDIRQMAQAMPLETIEKLFGGDILTKIRKKNVAKAKSAGPTGTKAQDVGAKTAEKEKPAEKKKTIREMFGV